MLNFFHNFTPEAIMFDLGFATIYWYGFFVVLAMTAAIFMALKGAKWHGIKKDDILDLSFFLIIFGIIGARLYDVLLEWPYYLEHPLQIIMVHQGGLAIHGGILAGLLVIFFWAKKKHHSYPELGLKKFIFKIASIAVPSVALGQAIGRWGNYFNQELFGLPTDKPWGIPIDLMNRPLDYISATHFQPTFFYESLGSLAIFLILIIMSKKLAKKKDDKNFNYTLLPLLYLITYSALRFSLEFIKVDITPHFLGLRWPQIMSLIIIIISITILIYEKSHAQREAKA